MRVAVGVALSAFLAFGDEPRGSPLTDGMSESRIGFNLGGNTELFVPFVTDALFLF